jgi:predicted aminopeptidase
MRNSKYLIGIVILFLAPAACGNISYLAKLGWYQGSIVFRSIPVEEALENDAISPGVKEKIRFVQAVKRYGEEVLGLEKNQGYTKFLEVRGPVLFVLTACEKERLHLAAWNFPIVGQVTYRGFFTREEALKEETSLRKRGLDTYLRQCGAYSTLGWLKDPIFSSMLKWNDATLSNVILHEMAHATIYYKGDTSLNEQVASYIGNRGSVDFLTQTYGAGSERVTEAVNMREDDLLFAKWIDRSCRALSDFYAQSISRDEKVRLREAVFRSLKEEFTALKPQLKTECYADFDQLELNNAVLLSFSQYMDRLDRFQTAFEALGWDLKRSVSFFKQIRATQERPSQFLAQWMQLQTSHSDRRDPAKPL